MVEEDGYPPCGAYRIRSQRDKMRPLAKGTELKIKRAMDSVWAQAANY